MANASLLTATQSPNRVSGRPRNLGAGDSTLALLRLVEETSGRAIGVEPLPERPGDVRDSLAGLDRPGEVLG